MMKVYSQTQKEKKIKKKILLNIKYTKMLNTLNNMN
jgi:hypothetical protein